MPVDPVVSSDGGTLTTSNAELAHIEEHNHNHSRMWGSDGSPGEDTAIAATVTVPFVAISGNNTWGAAVSIKGADDVPVLAANTEFDAHRILVVATDHTTPYRFRIIWGTGTSGDAITAGQWTEMMFMATAGPFNSGVPEEIRMPVLALATLLWVQVWNATNLSEVDFYWGAHGYS